jgi:hypothetical protein
LGVVFQDVVFAHMKFELSSVSVIAMTPKAEEAIWLAFSKSS